MNHVSEIHQRRVYVPTIVEEVLGDGRRVWIARHSAFRGLTVQGNSMEEAAAEFDVEVMNRVAHLRECNLDVPAPNGVVAEFKINRDRQTVILPQPSGSVACAV